MPPSEAAPPLGTVAIILNWNGAEDTMRCLDALSRSRPVPSRVIVVDNGSTDDSRALIRSRYPETQLIESERNLGYAGGINLGIRAALEAGAHNLLLLNNDVEIDPDCISRLEAGLEGDERIGAAGPIILNQQMDNRIWAAGGELSAMENITRLRGFGQVMNGQFRQDENVDYLPGCVLLVRRKAFEQVGLFKESYFCYMEDVDFGRRLVEQGYTNRLISTALAYHRPSSSTGGGYSPARKYMNAVNSVHFLRRHGTLRSWLGFFLFDVIGMPAAFVMASVHGRPGAALAKLRGIFDGLRGVKVTPDRVERYLR